MDNTRFFKYSPPLLGFPGGSSDKEPTCQCRRYKRPGFDPWVGKIPWRRTWQPTPIFLPGESPWTEKPGRLVSTGSQKVKHDCAKHTGLSKSKKKQDPTSCSQSNKLINKIFLKKKRNSYRMMLKYNNNVECRLQICIYGNF